MKDGQKTEAQKIDATPLTPRERPPCPTRINGLITVDLIKCAPASLEARPSSQTSRIYRSPAKAFRIAASPKWPQARHAPLPPD